MANKSRSRQYQSSENKFINPPPYASELEHKNIVVIIQIQMRGLAYIPSKIDKHKIYAEIQQQNLAASNPIKTIESISREQEMIDRKKLSKQDVERLLQRLAQNTKKEYNTEQQTTHILAVNLEIKKRREEGDKVENRLIDYGRRIEEKKEEMAKQIEAEQRQKYFREFPEISNKAKNLNQKAIDKRLNELIERKMSKLEELFEKYQPTFQPTINPQSDFINELQNYGDLQNRMDIRQKEATKRKESLVKAVEEKKKQECTFKPSINTNSKNIADHLPERKALFIATPKVKSTSEATKEINKQIYPFAPTINKNTDNLINKNGSQFESDCFRRLYNNAKDMLMKHQDKVEKRNRAYTFQPELNSRSLKLVASVNKRPKQQTLKEFSDEDSDSEYKANKAAPASNDYSRKKTYSVRNTKQSNKDWQVNLKQKCINVLHRGGKMGMNPIR